MIYRLKFITFNLAAKPIYPKEEKIEYWISNLWDNNINCPIFTSNPLHAKKFFITKAKKLLTSFQNLEIKKLEQWFGTNVYTTQPYKDNTILAKLLGMNYIVPSWTKECILWQLITE